MACGKSDVSHLVAMLSDFTNFYLFDQKKLAQELKRALKASKSEDLCHLSREFSRALWGAHFSAEAPWPLGSPAIPRFRPSATRAPLAVARTPWLREATNP
jgi:hypothetical protein